MLRQYTNPNNILQRGLRFLVVLLLCSLSVFLLVPVPSVVRNLTSISEDDTDEIQENESWRLSQESSSRRSDLRTPRLPQLLRFSIQTKKCGRGHQSLTIVAPEATLRASVGSGVRVLC